MKYSSINRSRCYCITLCRASNAVNAYYDEQFEREGISTKQYSLLSNLDRMGEASTSELAAHVNLERSTLTRNLKTLKEKGWIMDTAGEGRRNHCYVVTEAGREKMEKMEPVWEKIQKELEAFLGQGKLEELMEGLYKLQQLQKE